MPVSGGKCHAHAMLKCISLFMGGLSTWRVRLKRTVGNLPWKGGESFNVKQTSQQACNIASRLLSWLFPTLVQCCCNVACMHACLQGWCPQKVTSIHAECSAAERTYHWQRQVLATKQVVKLFKGVLEGVRMEDRGMYLQWTRTGPWGGGGLCIFTLCTKSRSRLECSGHPKSGQMLKCICFTMRSFRPCKKQGGLRPVIKAPHVNQWPGKIHIGRVSWVFYQTSKREGLGV